jgi:hypothetical protein
VTVPYDYAGSQLIGRQKHGPRSSGEKDGSHGRRAELVLGSSHVGCDLEYGPTGPARAALAGSFQYWAAERYCLYTLDDRMRVLRGEIHHPPWQLQPAEARIACNSMGRQLGVDLLEPSVLHYAHRQDVVFWPNRRVDGGR